MQPEARKNKFLLTDFHTGYKEASERKKRKRPFLFPVRSNLGKNYKTKADVYKRQQSMSHPVTSVSYAIDMTSALT